MPTMAMPPAHVPSARTFFPRSRVLLERRPVAFESDDEDGDTLALPNPQPPAPVGTKDSGVATEVAYVHEGRIGSECFDLSRGDVVAALQSLPKDTWTSLLNDDDRQRLAAYLPALDGWGDMPNEDAQRMAVEELLQRENLHFGNQLKALEASVRDGHCSVKATIAREAYKNHALARFAIERHAILSSRVEALKKSKEKRQGADEPQWKKIRVSNAFPYIYRKDTTESAPTQAVIVSEDSSIFLGIRSILQKDKLGVSNIVERLRRDYSHQCASAEKAIPLFLTFDKYIEAALQFLGGNHSSEGTDSSHWSSTVFVQFDEESKLYEWCRNQDKFELRSLLLLEQVFRAPIPVGFLDYSNNNSGVKATRKRRDRVLTQRAHDALLVSDSSFAALDAFQSVRPSLLLKRAQLEREGATARDSKPCESHSNS